MSLAACVCAGCGAEPAMVHSVAAEPAAMTISGVCRPEYLTLATAIEAYVASTGFMPESEGDLVTAGLLREDVEDFDALIADSNYEIVPAGDRCATFDPSVPG